MSQPLPSASATAFKEWSSVRDALRSGRQSIILRKGGIDEGSRGFTQRSLAFWIWPTRLHESEQGTLESPAGTHRLAPDTSIHIDTFTTVDAVARLESIEEVELLAQEHIWTLETLRARFAYRRPGLLMMVVRAYVRPSAIPIEATPEQAGCKSWVELETAIETAGIEPVLDEFRHLEVVRRIASSLPAGRLSTPAGLSSPTEEG
ncbi:MAG: DUF1802 family protein [Isosphaeraceae bacterium]|nr:DUF1802 family protein [Isosphaeraceae bacterium]